MVKFVFTQKKILLLWCNVSCPSLDVIFRAQIVSGKLYRINEYRHFIGFEPHSGYNGGAKGHLNRDLLSI